MATFSWVSRAILLATCAVVLVGCDQVRGLLGGGPRPALEKYLTATTAGNLDEAYGHISSQDRQAKTLAEYKSENSDNPFAIILARQTTYEIQDIQVDGANASATAKVTRPDLAGVAKDFFGAAFSAALGGKDSKQLQQQLADKYANQKLPTTTSSETFRLVKESDGWRVFLDWETQKRVSTAMAEAAELRKEKKLHAALAKLDEVLTLKSEMVEAKKQRAEVAKEIADFDRKQSYVDKVKLYDLNARYYETYLEKRVPGVTFKLKNTGDQTLKKVEVTVYFKNANGDVIHEESYHPVWVTKYSISDNKPLKPNYIWQLERGKFYQAKSVPDEWKAGSVSAKITDIEFE